MSETISVDPDFRQYNIDFNIGLSNLWNFLSFRANTGWQHSSLRASENFDMSSWKLGLNLGLYWKGWQLNMSAQDLVPTWYISGASEKYRYSSYTQLALYKKFGYFNLSASWSYPFRNTGMIFRTESLTSVVQRASEFRMKDQGNLFEIGIRYQFVTGKLLNKKQRSLQMPGSGENGVRWDY